MEYAIALKNAKKLLEDEGYLVIKPSRNQILSNEKCIEMSENGEDMECENCSCSCCLFQQ